MAEVQVVSPVAGASCEPATSSDELCRICFTHLTDAVTTQCSHTFCHECVVKWASTRRQPTCPLCKAPLERVTGADGVSQAVEAGSTNQAEEVPDLACLDTGFFMVEVGRLLQRTQGVHDRLLRDAYGCGRKGGAASLQSLDGLSEVMSTLQSYQQTLMDDGRFDAEVLMSDLYRLERAVSSLAAGRSDEVERLQDGVRGGGQQGRQGGGFSGSGRGGALLADHWPGLGDLQQGGGGEDERGYDDPGWHDADEEGGGDDEEAHHRAVARSGGSASRTTPGRRPAPRNQRRPQR